MVRPTIENMVVPTDVVSNQQILSNMAASMSRTAMNPSMQGAMPVAMRKAIPGTKPAAQYYVPPPIINGPSSSVSNGAAVMSGMMATEPGNPDSGSKIPRAMGTSLADTNVETRFNSEQRIGLSSEEGIIAQDVNNFLQQDVGLRNLGITAGMSAREDSIPPLMICLPLLLLGSLTMKLYHKHEKWVANRTINELPEQLVIRECGGRKWDRSSKLFAEEDQYTHAQRNPPFWVNALRWLLFNICLPSFFFRNLWMFDLSSSVRSYTVLSPVIHFFWLGLTYFLIRDTIYGSKALERVLMPCLGKSSNAKNLENHTFQEDTHRQEEIELGLESGVARQEINGGHVNLHTLTVHIVDDERVAEEAAHSDPGAGEAGDCNSLMAHQMGHEFGHDTWDGCMQHDNIARGLEMGNGGSGMGVENHRIHTVTDDSDREWSTHISPLDPANAYDLNSPSARVSCSPRKKSPLKNARMLNSPFSEFYGTASDDGASWYENDVTMLATPSHVEVYRMDDDERDEYPDYDSTQNAAGSQEREDSPSHSGDHGKGIEHGRTRRRSTSFDKDHADFRLTQILKDSALGDSLGCTSSTCISNSSKTGESEVSHRKPRKLRSEYACDNCAFTSDTGGTNTSGDKHIVFDGYSDKHIVGWLLLVCNGCMLSFLYPVLQQRYGTTAVKSLLWWDMVGNTPICQIVLFLIAALYGEWHQESIDFKNLIASPVSHPHPQLRSRKQVLSDVDYTLTAVLSSDNRTVHSIPYDRVEDELEDPTTERLLGSFGTSQSRMGGNCVSRDTHYLLQKKNQMATDSKQTKNSLYSVLFESGKPRILDTAGTSTLHLNGTPAGGLQSRMDHDDLKIKYDHDDLNLKHQSGLGCRHLVRQVFVRIKYKSSEKLRPIGRNVTSCVGEAIVRILPKRWVGNIQRHWRSGLLTSIVSVIVLQPVFIAMVSGMICNRCSWRMTPVIDRILQALESPFHLGLYFLSGAKADIFSVRRSHPMFSLDTARLMGIAFLIRSLAVGAVIVVLIGFISKKTMVSTQNGAQMMYPNATKTVDWISLLAVLSPPSSFPIILLDLFRFPSNLGAATVGLWTVQMLFCVVIQNVVIYAIP